MLSLKKLKSRIGQSNAEVLEMILEKKSWSHKLKPGDPLAHVLLNKCCTPGAARVK